MTEDNAARRFELAVAPHLDAAYNLARWLTRTPHDADDVVQEACLRALRYFDGFRGGDARAWLLAIVRNTFYTWLEQNRRGEPHLEYNEATDGLLGMDTALEPALHGTDPERLLLRSADRGLVEKALLALPAEYREILVLRELEELSYKQISEIAGLPLGTVMSRLSRARTQLRLQIEAMEPR